MKVMGEIHFKQKQHQVQCPHGSKSMVNLRRKKPRHPSGLESWTGRWPFSKSTGKQSGLGISTQSRDGGKCFCIVSGKTMRTGGI